jgi:hypothetical protein
MTQDKQELLPCPFCGGEAELYRVGNDHTKSQSAVISCKKPGCFGEQEVGVIRQSYEWAVQKVTEKWNTRHSPVSSQDAKQALDWFENFTTDTANTRYESLIGCHHYTYKETIRRALMQSVGNESI